MTNFASQKITKWEKFVEAIGRLHGRWIFRGQAQDWPLATSLERALKGWDIPLRWGPKIEQQLIREFRRRYDGTDRHLVDGDTLYCLALMQHHGAPTRLLDSTYSPFVAAQFAIGRGSVKSEVWCVNTRWLRKTAKDIDGVGDLMEKRQSDSKRNNSTFTPLFMSEPRHKFISQANAFNLGQRLTIQQGVFLCPGDVSAKFLTNLKTMKGWEQKDNILRLDLGMKRRPLLDFSDKLRRTNVDSATLFPGLDGFAESLHERMPLYHDFAQRGVGG